VLVAMLAGPGTMTVRASDIGSRVLDPSHQAVTWSSQDANPTGAGVGPPTEQTCTTMTCDTLQLDIQFPPGTFPEPSDGVLVSIKWATDFDQWNLYVDAPDGTPLAQGTELDSNAQSVLLRQPANGRYTIHTVPFQTTQLPGDLTYQGRAELYLDPIVRTAPGTELLPQLQTTAPSEFVIGGVPPIASNGTGWRWTPPATFSNSCYLDETLDYGSTRCLRFSNDIRNVGPGALILRFRYDQNLATACQMQQEIAVAGGAPIDRDAGPCVFHTQHGHFHYQNMARYQLYAVGGNGRPGRTPVSASKKVGFCAIDVDDHAFGGPPFRERPRTYTFPTCNVPNNIPTSNPAVWEYMGISSGWGDIYTWDLAAQYIDISHIGDGMYEVVSRANPDGRITEAATGLETGITCIRITGNAVTSLHSYPSQSNSAQLPSCRA
jgi:hypothetical protein